MKRSEMLAKIAVQILEDDTNEEIHGEGKEMSYEQMARIALEVCEKEGMLPPASVKYTEKPPGNTLCSETCEWDNEND
jgi:hypothetical protein